MNSQQHNDGLQLMLPIAGAKPCATAHLVVARTFQDRPGQRPPDHWTLTDVVGPSSRDRIR
jgi:hypothetical protein